MICPICKSNNTDPLLDYGQYPYFTVPVKKSDKKKILTEYSKERLSSDLRYKACKNCGHVYIRKIPDQNIIDDLYSNYYSYPSPLKGEFKPKRDNNFIRLFKEKFHSICIDRKLVDVLEIGCFDGYVLQKLKKEGYNVNGCDPSEGAEIGKGFGLNIQKEFFDPNNYLNYGTKFDIVISRHYIEHTINPNEFIISLKSVLNDDGLLILETPNIQHFIEKGLLEVFSLQHITLFTAQSLKYLLNKTGLEVLLIEKTPDNLIIIAKKSNNHKQINSDSFGNIINRFNKQVFENKKRIENIIKDFINRESSIAIWGAGGFGIAALTLYNIPLRSINFFIDSDPQKWGMEYITNNIQIISPQKAKEIKPDLIIAASMYNNGILKAINEIELNSSVLLLSPDVLLRSFDYKIQ